MEKIISSPRFTSDALARSLEEHLEEQEEALGLTAAVFYYDFPSFRDYEDEPYKPHILLLSPSHGLVAMLLLAGDTQASLIEADDSLTQFFSILYGRLLKSRLLRKTKTELLIPFHSIIFVPSLDFDERVRPLVENEICTSIGNIDGWLRSHRIDETDPEIILEARSIVEGAKALNRPKAREVTTELLGTKAGILSAIEAEIANFDEDQRRAGITRVPGPVRIRGLAGTGKTIVLAMKAAQLHLEDPAARILYTFYTKSLYDLIKLLITRFYRQYKDSDPNWDTISVLHAWGGANMEGVYYSTCVSTGVPPIRFQDVPANVENRFGYVCNDLLTNGAVKPVYDHVLIDEGQDLPESFFRLCFHLTEGTRDEKNITWAYDELQNIFAVKVRSPKELFGTDESGDPLIDLERAASRLPQFMSNDIVLRRSYRNPKEILVCAHALGFALYSPPIVQMLENKEHWEDVGYEVLEGDFQTGSATKILRPDANSPLDLAKREPKENIIQHFAAPTYSEELDWIQGQIEYFLSEGLSPEEIMVISLDDRHARKYFDDLASRLLKKEISCNNILDNPYTSSHFAVPKKITFSTVHRAKGNEAAVVLAAGIDALYPLRQTRSGRNRIFTAFTRTKAWLRVSGTGQHAEGFLVELTTALTKSPYLEFQFPNLKEVELLQRDLNKREVKLVRLRERYRKELERLGLSEDELTDFYFGDTEKRTLRRLVPAFAPLNPFYANAIFFEVLSVCTR